MSEEETVIRHDKVEEQVEEPSGYWKGRQTLSSARTLPAN